MALEISVNKKQDGVFFVSLLGSIDSETYTELETKMRPILSSLPKVVIFDMDGVNYISSMGVSLVITTKKEIEKNKGVFIMTNLQSQIKKVFEIVATLPNLKIFSSVEEADAYLAKMQQDELKRKNSP
jgi:anti-sigma B factor antagonist